MGSLWGKEPAAAAEGRSTAEEMWEGMSPGCPGGAGKGPAVPGVTHHHHDSPQSDAGGRSHT